MLKNRTLQLRFVDDNVAPRAINQTTNQAASINVTEAVTAVAVSTMAVISTYMLADAIRQSIIYTVCTKIK
jgi:hypothetical protein